MLIKPYTAHGIWVVTTEGDCEGRTTKHLGVHEGYLDEIAFSLGGRACYGLRFERAEVMPKRDTIPVNEISVSLGIDSGTWPTVTSSKGMDDKERVKFFENMLRGRKVIVRPSNYYACVTLVADKEVARENLRRSALYKLSKEEKEVLGLV